MRIRFNFTIIQTSGGDRVSIHQPEGQWFDSYSTSCSLHVEVSLGKDIGV